MAAQTSAMHKMLGLYCCFESVNAEFSNLIQHSNVMALRLPTVERCQSGSRNFEEKFDAPHQ